MPFGAAAALAYGRASLAEYVEGAPERPEIRRLMPLVRCVTDPELDAHFPREFRAWAEVATTDGRRLRHQIPLPQRRPGKRPILAGNESQVPRSNRPR